MVEVLTVMPNKKKLGEVFKREAKPIQDALDALGEEDAACLQSDLEAGMFSFPMRALKCVCILFYVSLSHAHFFRDK